MNKFWKYKFANILLFLFLFSVFLISCSKEKKAQQEIVIGAILPLTGDLSSYGVDTRKSIDLALEEFNTNNSCNVRFKLFLEDSQGDPKMAVSAFNKLILNKVVGIIGPITSAEVLSIAPLANAQKIVIISPSATSVDISRAGSYIFRTINADNVEAAGMARFVLKKLKINKVGILALNTAGTLSYANSFENFFIKLGGNVLIKELFLPNEKVYRTKILKVLDKKPLAIYVSGYSEEIGRMIKQIREIDKNILLLSYQSAEDPRVVEIAKDAVNGLYFSSTTLPPKVLGDAYKSFLEKFYNKYNKKPGIFAPEAYDATKLLLSSICRIVKDSKYDIEIIKERLPFYLKNIKNYKGSSGLISFDENGDVHKPIAIYKYENLKPKLIEVVKF